MMRRDLRDIGGAQRTYMPERLNDGARRTAGGDQVLGDACRRSTTRLPSTTRRDGPSVR
jgi:hypothetical protein